MVILERFRPSLTDVPSERVIITLYLFVVERYVYIPVEEMYCIEKGSLMCTTFTVTGHFSIKPEDDRSTISIPYQRICDQS